MPCHEPPVNLEAPDMFLIMSPLWGVSPDNASSIGSGVSDGNPIQFHPDFSVTGCVEAVARGAVSVTVTALADGKTLPPYRIVGSQEADVMNRCISEDSPFGSALMGHKVGDEVAVEAPRGIIRYRVEKIER